MKSENKQGTQPTSMVCQGYTPMNSNLLSILMSNNCMGFWFTAYCQLYDASKQDHQKTIGCFGSLPDTLHRHRPGNTPEIGGIKPCFLPKLARHISSAKIKIFGRIPNRPRASSLKWKPLKMLSTKKNGTKNLHGEGGILVDQQWSTFSFWSSCLVLCCVNGIWSLFNFIKLVWTKESNDIHFMVASYLLETWKLQDSVRHRIK